MSVDPSQVVYRRANTSDVDALAGLRRDFLLEVAEASPDAASVLPRLRNWVRETVGDD